MIVFFNGSANEGIKRTITFSNVSKITFFSWWFFKKKIFTHVTNVAIDTVGVV